MIFNTTLSILSGTSEDDFGDVYDNATVAASGVPASILEQPARTITVQADDRQQVVRRYIGRISSAYSVTTLNRIRDDRTGDVYVIDNVSGPSYVKHKRLDLRRVT